MPQLVQVKLAVAVQEAVVSPGPRLVTSLVPPAEGPEGNTISLVRKVSHITIQGEDSGSS